MTFHVLGWLSQSIRCWSFCGLTRIVYIARGGRCDFVVFEILETDVVFEVFVIALEGRACERAGRAVITFGTC